MVRQIKRKWRRFYRTHREGCELVGDFVGALSMYRNALATNPFYPVFISASEISGHHEEIEKLSKEFGFN